MKEEKEKIKDELNICKIQTYVTNIEYFFKLHFYYGLACGVVLGIFLIIFWIKLGFWI